MEVVIDIPDKDYEKLKDGHIPFNILDVMQNGTPLPKGHGDIVDLDQMCYDYWDGNYMEIHKDDLPNIPVIIKADKGEE